MANIKSAKKRVEVIKRRREENKLVKSTISTKIKNYRKTLASKDFAKAEEQLVEITALVNSACSKGVLHKNNSSRKVSRLSIALSNAKKENGIVAAPAAPKAEAKKATTKKAEVKEAKEVKAEPKKATAKKTTAKKAETETKTTEAKKAPAKKAATTKKAAATEEKPAKKTAAKKTTTKKAE